MGMNEYSSNEVDVSLAGYTIDGGWSEDETFIEIEYDEDPFTLHKGVDGEGVRARTNNRSATIRIHLMQGAASNAVLSALHNGDLAAQNGAGVGVLKVNDRNGTPKYFGEHAWVQSPPNPSYAKGPVTRTWTCRCNHLDSFEGAY